MYGSGTVKAQSSLAVRWVRPTCMGSGSTKDTGWGLRDEIWARPSPKWGQMSSTVKTVELPGHQTVSGAHGQIPHPGYHLWEPCGNLSHHTATWSSQGSKLDWVVRTWAVPMAEQNQMLRCFHPIHWSAKHLDYLSLKILKGEQKRNLACHSVVPYLQTQPVNSRLGIKWSDQRTGNLESLLR